MWVRSVGVEDFRVARILNLKVFRFVESHRVRSDKYNSVGNSEREADVIFVRILTTIAENNMYTISVRKKSIEILEIVSRFLFARSLNLVDKLINVPGTLKFPASIPHAVLMEVAPLSKNLELLCRTYLCLKLCISCSMEQKS
ncbi:hypothetical protein QLX08_004412 [Tetragonisca angustula]|uniref:Uncharacterized protein n=1 Tax=Tetragonisca angustula TaxID=166442 RepID=A0AAW1A291_9HYME